MRKFLRLLVQLLVAGSILYLLRYGLKQWVDGPEPSPSAPPWPAPTETPRTAPPVNLAAPPGGARPPESRRTDPADPSWVDPDETGAAPSSHPIKVRVRSGIYRVPGTASYDRSRADRCYQSVEAAEADGFVRAKR